MKLDAKGRPAVGHTHGYDPDEDQRAEDDWMAQCIEAAVIDQWRREIEAALADEWRSEMLRELA